MIELRDVWHRYPEGVEALKGVSLKVGEGEFLAIMGKSGAGKTTLIKHFNGLLKPTKGSVTVDGLDTRKATIAELSRKVGIVFQNPDHQLFAETVTDEVAFALKNFGFEENEIERRVSYVLKLFGLERFSSASPLALSGGEKKRLTIASVLAWEPKYLVLDEPTLGQDYSYKVKLKEIFRQLLAKGKTVVLVTHDVEFVAECGCSIVLMADGKIIASGSAKETLTDPELVRKASLLLPQLAEVFLKFKDVGFPVALDLDEAERVILERVRGAGKR